MPARSVACAGWILHRYPYGCPVDQLIDTGGHRGTKDFENTARGIPWLEALQSFRCGSDHVRYTLADFS